MGHPDKIYFNVTLNYNDSKVISKKRNTSIAEKEIQVIDPLIDDTNQYDLCISKFRLDTLTIPLVIPELKQPQKVEDSMIELDYWVKLVVASDIPEDDLLEEQPGQPHISPINYLQTAQSYLSLIPKNIDPKGGMKRVDDYDVYDISESYKITKPILRYTNTEKTIGFINNLDPFCYIYEAQEFVDSINRAIAEVIKTGMIFEEGTLPNLEAFFKLEGSDLKFYQNAKRLPYFLVFSQNLYRYFGLGFNTKRLPEYDGWMIAVDNNSRNIPQTAEFSYNTNTFGNPNFNLDNMELKGTERQYNIATAQFSVTQTWNACKIILICSNTLPIRGEYVPLSEWDGLLIHEPSEKAKRIYESLHKGEKDSTQLNITSIMTPSVKVLESFYPISSQGGDIRTQIIFSNDTLDTGTKNAMQGSSCDIRKFDVSVKWVDIYNNLHDLELMEGSSCDIRLAFVKKAVKQDLILTGFKEVIKTLNGEFFDPPSLKKPTSNSSKLPGGGFKFTMDEYL